MTSRILVTGGAGFVGANLVRAVLARGDLVTVLDTGTACGLGNLTSTTATVITGDVRNPDAVRRAVSGCDAIVHLAAQVGVPESIADPVSDHSLNVGASLSILEAAREAAVSRFAFASSNATMAGDPPPAREGLAPSPIAPYGASKAAVEAYLRAYANAFGLETVAFRFSNVYGPWSGHKSSVVAALIKKYLHGGPLTIKGSGDQTRDYIYVDDVARALIAGLDAPADLLAGDVFQIGTGRETTLNELAQAIFDVGGHEVPIIHTDPSPGDVPRNYSDISKAQRVLGWSPQVDLRDGLERTLRWFRDNWQG